MKRIGLVVALMALVVGPVFADDMHDPPWWDLTDDGATYARFDFPTDQWNPVVIDNLYGTAVLDIENCFYEPTIDWNGNPVSVWHVGPGGKISITVDNKPEPDEYKLIFWQITATGSPTATGNPPSTGLPNTTYPPTGIPHGQKGDTPWYDYNGAIRIEPNPDQVTITFEDFVECTYIEEIVIDTICAPEPATLGLLAVGSALMLVRRRRR